ncbi:MAG: betaine/proline/choline family ABC transporter ATP-binding protein [Chloroflexota bacterium]|nr:betaine/proline/choline family ABC transporter ATP-binding protein [Chloroflexota bacterium]
MENVTKVYHGNVQAVKAVSFTIPDGEVCILIGPSGCGKTTLLKMINRLIEPTRGRILIDGQDISQMNPQELRRNIGYAIQEIGLFPHLTVEGNIGIVPSLKKYPKSRIRQRVEELLVLVGLDPAEFRDKYPNQLSGGQRQRVGVARALGADPPILLMDEPFGAIDPITRTRLQDEFLKIQQKLKKTIAFVTHDMDEALKMGDRIALLKEGELVQCDTPQELLAHPINDFVRDFIGADSAIKRLALISVDEIMETGVLTVGLKDTIGDLGRVVEGASQTSVAVVDENGLPRGWLDLSVDRSEDLRIADVIRIRDTEEIAVNGSMRVRDALSKMLNTGLSRLVVIDDQKQLKGEITFFTCQQILKDSKEHL